MWDSRRAPSHGLDVATEVADATNTGVTYQTNRMDDLLRSAYELRASDVHISVGACPAFRVDGHLRAMAGQKLTPSDTEIMAREILSPEQFAYLQEVGEIDLSYSIPSLSRFRVNVYRQRGCYGIAIRIIPTHVPSLEELSLPAIFTDFARQPQGLLLVTGPTGSGKSTTLASLIDYINRTQERHIVTLEDPIEYLHRHGKSIINQREVGQDTKSFANGLRAALRQDPDVILIGEMRDLETIQTAVTAAETGHLVLATLHTASAPQTIERIIDVFPTHQQGQIRLQLASVLVGIAAQRLLPKLDGGRVAAFEILVNTPAIGNLIRTEKVHQIQTVIQTSRAVGMQTMDMHLRELADKGFISTINSERR